MNAIEMLREQHREVEKLFEAVEGAGGQDEQLKYFQELASKLVGHDGIEREIFYPACEEELGMDEELSKALVEHGVVEFSLYQADQASGGPDFDAKVGVLKELLAHHIREEEAELFPKVQEALGDERLELLGEELSEAFEDLVSEDYHVPLFENLRQVLAGTLKPNVDDIDEKDDGTEPRRRSPRRRGARPSA